MALAVLRYEDSVDGRARFRFDIGVNRYYAYAVGDEATIQHSGIVMLQDPHHRSPIRGPLPESAMGRGTLEISNEVLDREHRFVQFMSFRTRDRTGPAISDIVQVPIGGALQDLPELSFGQEYPMEKHSTYVETVPLGFREARYSNAMFLGALANILPSILPHVGSLVGNLLGGGGSSSGGNGGGGGATRLPNAIGNEQAMRQIVELVQQIARLGAGGNASTTAPSTAPSGGAAPQAASLTWRGRLRARHARHRPVAKRRSYSEAQVAPALLAALPALMPLLKQVLNPQTIQTVLDAPNRHMGTVINGLKDFAKLGMESHEQDLRHLRELNPGVNDPALDALLASMSVGLSQERRELDYRRVRSVHLRFEEVQTQTLYGRTKVAYRYGQSLAFPFSVETPRPIRRALVQLQVKDLDTLEVVVQKRERIEGVAGGRAPLVPTLSEGQVRTLEPDKGYLVCLALVWENRAGEKRGASVTLEVELVGDYVFDRVEASSELIPLNDVARFREYWHKVWQGRFDDGVKRFVLECKYYYALNSTRTTHARIETRVRTQEPEDRRVTGRLKTGMELSPEGLNRLLTRLAPGERPLSEGELRALRARDFVERFNQAARYTAKLRGRAGDSAALWVYPEFKLQRVVLQKVGQVNGNGLVTSFVEHPVRFPMPALVHFIGTRTA